MNQAAEHQQGQRQGQRRRQGGDGRPALRPLDQPLAPSRRPGGDGFAG
jgi:hypothetical protein